MKKLFFALPIVALLAAGCNSSQQTTNQKPVQAPVTQNTPTLTPVSPTTTPVQTSNLKTYQNSDLGFQLQYPDDWTIEGVQQTSNSGMQLTGIFSISKQISTTDQYGEQANDPAQFSIAIENIAGVSIQDQSKEIANSSNYKLGSLVAKRDVQDGPNTVYTLINFVRNGKLVRINYSWSAVSGQGQIDANATANKKQILDIFNKILASFKFSS